MYPHWVDFSKLTPQEVKDKNASTIKDILVVFGYVNNTPVTRVDLVTFYKLLKKSSTMSTPVQWNRAVTTCFCNYDKVFKMLEITPHDHGKDGCIRSGPHVICRRNIDGCVEECVHKGVLFPCNRVGNTLHWVDNDIWNSRNIRMTNNEPDVVEDHVEEDAQMMEEMNHVEPILYQNVSSEKNGVARDFFEVNRYYNYRFDRENVLYMGKRVYFLSQFVPDLDQIKNSKDVLQQKKICKRLYKPDHELFAKMSNAFTFVERIVEKGGSFEERWTKYKEIINSSRDKDFTDENICAEILEVLDIGIKLRSSR